MASLTVAEIGSLLKAPAEGDGSRLITGANALADAGPSDLSFASNKPSLEQSAASSKAGCLIVPLNFQFSGSSSLIRVAEPRAAFAQVLHALFPPPAFTSSVHPTAVIADTASIASDCYIGPHVTIGHSATVDSGCVIAAGCVLGDHVAVGNNSHLYSNVSLYNGVRIGARVIIHANAVIGADGFGFTIVNGHYRKFPQVGTVEIQDDVEIGAGCCIDRAALGVTRIGRGTKLDNLVHVAHNCTIGEDVVVAAQTGFSGSVTVGDYAVIGGQAGIGEKARIDSRAIV